VSKKVATFLLEQGPRGFRAVADIRKKNGDPVRRVVGPWQGDQKAAAATAEKLRDQLCGPQ
jgi:hypothetical protein